MSDLIKSIIPSLNGKRKLYPSDYVKVGLTDYTRDFGDVVKVNNSMVRLDSFSKSKINLIKGFLRYMEVFPVSITNASSNINDYDCVIILEGFIYEIKSFDIKLNICNYFGINIRVSDVPNHYIFTTDAGDVGIKDDEYESSINPIEDTNSSLHPYDVVEDACHKKDIFNYNKFSIDDYSFIISGEEDRDDVAKCWYILEQSIKWGDNYDINEVLKTLKSCDTSMSKLLNNIKNR